MPNHEDKPNILDEILSRAGVSSSLLQKVRFRGPVGKLALIAVFSVIALGSIGVRASSQFAQGLCAVLAATIALAIGGAILWYSHHHPQEATLEGMEVVIAQQQKYWAEAAAKGIPPGSMGQQLAIPNPSKGPESEE